MLSTSLALGFGEGAVGVDFPLEAGQERGASGGGDLAGVVARVKDEGADPAAHCHIGRVEGCTLGGSHGSPG